MALIVYVCIHAFALRLRLRCRCVMHSQFSFSFSFVICFCFYSSPFRLCTTTHTHTHCPYIISSESLLFYSYVANKFYSQLEFHFICRFLYVCMCFMKRNAYFCCLFYVFLSFFSFLLLLRSSYLVWFGFK